VVCMCVCGVCVWCVVCVWCMCVVCMCVVCVCGVCGDLHEARYECYATGDTPTFLQTQNWKYRGALCRTRRFNDDCKPAWHQTTFWFTRVYSLPIHTYLSRHFIVLFSHLCLRLPHSRFISDFPFCMDFGSLLKLTVRFYLFPVTSSVLCPVLGPHSFLSCGVWRRVVEILANRQRHIQKDLNCQQYHFENLRSPF